MNFLGDDSSPQMKRGENTEQANGTMQEEGKILHKLLVGEIELWMHAENENSSRWFFFFYYYSRKYL